jgi:hypothetical protein
VRGLTAGQPGVEVTGPPGAVDELELLARRDVESPLEIPTEDLVDALDDTDVQAVGRSDRRRGLLCPDGDRGVDRRDRLLGEPLRKRGRLRVAERVQRGTGRS